MLTFAFDASQETPQSTAAKRALIAQIMGATRTPRNIGEGFSAIGDGIVSNVLGGRAAEGEKAGRESADSTFSTLVASLTGKGAPTPSYAPQTASDAAAALAGTAVAPPQSVSFGGDQEAFIQALMPSAIEASKRTGVDPRIIVAQAAQETGWGRSAPNNNFFGIKSHGQSGGGTFETTEYVNGQPVRVRDSFRGYESPEASVMGYADFLLENPRYRPMMQAQGLDAQLEQLGLSGYATDPGYANSVGSIARGIPMPEALGTSVGTSSAQVAQGPDLAMLMEASANPWLNDSQKAIINSMISQQMQQQDPAYQMGLEKSRLELEAMRNPAAPKPIEVGGVLVDPTTFEPLFDSRQPAEGGFTLSPGQQRFDAQGNPIASGAPAAAPRPMSPEDRAMWGIPDTDKTPYYLDENGQPKPISGGGQTINVGGNNDIGTIPAGMMVTRDAAGNVTGMQAIPGSPAEREAQAAAEAAKAWTNQTSRYGNVVVEDIDRALEVLATDPTWSTGILGQAMGNFKGSSSDRLNNLLDTVRANSAFDRLQAMRDASPTGGALGAVSERELGLLQSAIGSLETGNAEDLAYNLKRLQTIYSEIIDGPKAATPPNQSQAPADIDALLELYR